MTATCQHPTSRPQLVAERPRGGGWRLARAERLRLGAGRLRLPWAERLRLSWGGRLRLAAVLGAIASGMVMAGPAHAQQSVRFLSAGMLHERLLSDDPFAREAGKHYVLGVLDTLALRRDPRVCLGPELEANDLVIVVMRHLAARPEMHRYNAASFVREAVATEFPCV